MIYNGGHIILRGQFIEFNMLRTSPNDAQLPLMFFVPASFKLTLHRRRSLTRVLTT